MGTDKLRDVIKGERDTGFSMSRDMPGVGFIRPCATLINDVVKSVPIIHSPFYLPGAQLVPQ